MLIAISAAAIVLDGASADMHHFTITTLINIATVVGLYVFIGNSGLLSFGHVAFMAIGAYAAGILTMPVMSKALFLPDLPHWLGSLALSPVAAMLVAVLLTMVVAAILGIPLMRLSGIATGIGTFAVLVIVQVVITQWDAVTGGNKTLSGIPFWTNVGVCLAVVVLSIVVAACFDVSRVALRLRASRDDPYAASALGISIVRVRIVAFALSAGIVAAAGALYGGYLGSLSPDTFYLQLTFATLAMLIVGGMYSLEGAVVGATVISIVMEIVGRLEDGRGVGPLHLDLPSGSTNIALALSLLAILRFRPEGLVRDGSGRRSAVLSLVRRRRPREQPTAS